MNNTIQSIIRHALTFGGGILVTKGLLSEGTVAELAGALSSLVGLIWGAVDEYRAEKAAKAK
jgi:hypothetical protein